LLQKNEDSNSAEPNLT